MNVCKQGLHTETPSNKKTIHDDDDDCDEHDDTSQDRRMFNSQHGKDHRITVTGPAPLAYDYRQLFSVDNAGRNLEPR
jgi:hypothetical protein